MTPFHARADRSDERRPPTLEVSLHIPVSHGRLEAHFRPGEGPARGAAVVCHPHPQHGGTMHTKAVFRTAQALSEVGFDALRFNFRGVGTSSGSYGGGVGEAEDVRAAIDWLAEREPDAPLLLAGFSFGARVGLEVGVRDDRVRALLGLGLPLSMADFTFLREVAKPTLLIQGENDEFGGGETVRELVDRLGGKITLVRIPDSDHYFHGRFEELQTAIRDYFTEGPGGSSFPVPTHS